jgi:serine/threonine-protein kinase RsbW
LKDEQVFDLTVDANLDQLQEVRAFIDEAGQNLGLTETAMADLRLVVDEAVTNIVLHGYEGQPGPIEIQMKADGRSVIIRLRDRAKTFDPAQVSKPQLETALKDRAFGGMGIFLIRKMTDEAIFEPLPGGGNELRLVKHGAVQTP